MGPLLLHSPQQQTGLSFKVELGLQLWHSRVRQIIHFCRARVSASLQIFWEPYKSDKKLLPSSVLTGTDGMLGHLASRRLAASCVISAKFFFFPKTYSPKAQITVFLGLLTYFDLIFFYVFLKSSMKDWHWQNLCCLEEVAPSAAEGNLPNFPSEIPAFRHQHFLQHGEGTVLAGAKLAASVVVCPGRLEAVTLRAWQDPGWRLEGWERGNVELCVVLYPASSPAPCLEQSP